MGKGLPRSLARASSATVQVRKATIAVAATLSNVDGATGVGWDTIALAGLPEGNIFLLGALANLTVTKTTASITTTFDGDISVGTTPASDGTLTAGDADILASTALGAATASVSPTVRITNVTPVMLDNTAGTLEVNLNVLIDDASISANDQEVIVEGELYLLYSVLGDD